MVNRNVKYYWKLKVLLLKNYCYWKSKWDEKKKKQDRFQKLSKFLQFWNPIIAKAISMAKIIEELIIYL